MPSMHDDVYHAMVTNLDVLRDRMLTLIPFDMTHRECLELIAPPEHLDILTGAAKYADIHAAEEWVAVYTPAVVDGEKRVRVRFQMRTHAEKEPPLRPRHPEWQPGRGGHAKAIAWVDARLRLGRRFGLAHRVLYELREACDTGAQLRYVWPACMHLLKPAREDAQADLRVETWAKKHAEFKPQRHTPSLSLAMRDAVREAGALITSAVLMGEDVQPAPLGEVLIGLGSMPTFEHDSKQVLRK